MAPAIALGALAEQRFEQLRLDHLSPDQHLVAAEALGMSSDGLKGLYNVMLRSPELSQRLLPLEDYIRAKTTLSEELSQFAIIIQARYWRSQEMWKSHYPAAIKAGLSKTVAEDLRMGRHPAGMSPSEAAVYDLCMELSTSHKVSDATFAEAKKLFNDKQIVDLAATFGTYSTFAMLLATGNEGATDGSTPLQALASGSAPSARPTRD